MAMAMAVARWRWRWPVSRDAAPVDTTYRRSPPTTRDSEPWKGEGPAEDRADTTCRHWPATNPDRQTHRSLCLLQCENLADRPCCADLEAAGRRHAAMGRECSSWSSWSSWLIPFDPPARRYGHRWSGRRTMALGNRLVRPSSLRSSTGPKATGLTSRPICTDRSRLGAEPRRRSRSGPQWESVRSRLLGHRQRRGGSTAPLGLPGYIQRTPACRGCPCECRPGGPGCRRRGAWSTNTIQRPTSPARPTSGRAVLVRRP